MSDFSSISSRQYIIAAFVLMTAALCAPRALSFLPGLCGLAVYALACFSQKKFMPVPATPLYVLGAIIVFVSLSFLWTPTDEDTVERGTKLLVLFGGGIFWITCSVLADPRPPVKYIQVLALLFGTSAALLTIERHADMPLMRFILGLENETLSLVRLNRSLVVLSVFLVPVLSLLEGLSDTRKIVMGWQTAMIVALGCALYGSTSQTAQLAALVGLFFYYGAPVHSRFFWKALAGLIVIACLSAPFVARMLEDNTKQYFTDNALTMEASIPHRFEIWGFVSRAALERPLLGHGIEATRHMTSDRWMTFMNANNVLHPHNATLQVWIEFGLLGICLYIALLLFLLRKAWQYEHPLARRTALAALMAALCMANTGYGLWQGWQLGLFIALCGLVLFANRRSVTV